METGISVSVVMILFGLFIWYNHNKEQEQNAVFLELQGKYNYLDSVYYPLKRKYDELTFKYESIKLFLRGEIIDNEVYLLYELLNWSEDIDEDEELEDKSRFLVTPEFFNSHVVTYKIERRKLWTIFMNLEKLGYIKRGFENHPTFGRIHWAELTDKARLYFEYEDLKHIGDMKR